MEKLTNSGKPSNAEMRELSYRLFLLVAVPLVTVHSYLVRDAIGFQQPAFARIFFWHFPCPMIATVLLSMATFFAWKYSQTRSLEWDVRATAATELAMIFIVLTMISGIFFSKIQWGAWWQNDPRQVSFLLVMAIYSGYFALRSAFSDQDQKAKYSNAFHLFAILPFFFLTFVFPRLPQVDTFHPNESIMKGNIKGGYAYVVIEVLAVASLVTAWVYRLRVRAGLLTLKIDHYGTLENSRLDTAHSHVVRPVSLSDES
jgi:heme exporter protein C